MIFAACAAQAPGSAPAPGHAIEHAPADTTRKGYTAADVRFMQMMIGHHAQALEMAALVPSRTDSEAMKLLAERIDVSQRDEIALMERWLAARGESIPARDAHHHAMAGHGDLMPGMLTRQEMDALAAARGADFDRMFLESMIRHHEGAIEMVEELLGTGGGQEAELFVFISDVNADQTAEIKRMRAMLARMDALR